MADLRMVIAGSRYLENYEVLAERMNRIHAKNPITEVVSGCARGADSLGEMWAEDNHIPIARFPADWEGLGKRAGHVRNAQMADHADAAVIFAYKGSRGSENMRYQMQARGKPFLFIDVSEHIEE